MFHGHRRAPTTLSEGSPASSSRAPSVFAGRAARSPASGRCFCGVAFLLPIRDGCDKVMAELLRRPPQRVD